MLEARVSDMTVKPVTVVRAKRNIAVTSAFDKGPCPCTAVMPLSADDAYDCNGCAGPKLTYTLQY